jgi:hypothetical protein
MPLHAWYEALDMPLCELYGQSEILSGTCNLPWDHWDRCRIHWFPGNHLIHLDQGKYLNEMLAFMRGIDFH